MSILDLISERVRETSLHELSPTMPENAEVTRKMYASDDVLGLLEYRDSSEIDPQRVGTLKADFDRFITGQPITYCLEPRKAKSAFMGILDPATDGIWDIRSQDPEPGVRVLGGFASEDVFVALCYRLRAPLGDKNSREWRQVVLECKAQWTRLFNPYNPVTGENIHDFITSNVYAV